jgi:hypothetical protein
MSWLGRLAARRGAATVQWAPLGGGCGGDRAERESGAVGWWSREWGLWILFNAGPPSPRHVAPRGHRGPPGQHGGGCTVQVQQQAGEVDV